MERRIGISKGPNRATPVYRPDTRTPEEYQRDLAKLQPTSVAREGSIKGTRITIGRFAKRLNKQRGIPQGLSPVKQLTAR
ncbi:MAG: hypothetical protein AAB521_01735 [Patescibacteria group bacterium]